MSTTSQNCPWCGHALPSDAATCPQCHWSRKQHKNRRAILLYAFFIVFMLVLGLLTFLWSLRYQRGVDTMGLLPSPLSIASLLRTTAQSGTM